MAGVGYQSSDLLAQFNRWAGRPRTDAVTPTVKFDYLADAQDYVIQRIAAVSAKTIFAPPYQLTTSDGGLTYTFGTDANGYPLFPMGRTGIYDNLNAIPGGAWTPGVDYLDEGTTIRMSYAVPFAGPLYAYGCQMAPRMGPTVQPVLNPPNLRLLIVRKAVESFADSALRNQAMADRQAVKFEKELGEALLMLRKHFKDSGTVGRWLTPWGIGAYGPGWAGAWW